MTLDNIPLKTFCILLDDPTKCKSYGLSEEEWDSLRLEYQENNPTPEETVLLTAFRKVVRSSCQNSGYSMILNVIYGIKEDWKPYFKAMNLKFQGDRDKDEKYLRLQIQKAKTKESINAAKLDKIEEDLIEAAKNRTKEEFNIQKVNEAIASIELAGANIPDYDTLTLGKYNALGSMIKAKTVKQ